MVKLQLEPDERALLVKLAKTDQVSIGEYLRLCMLADGVTRFDPDALAICKRRASDKVKARLATLWGPLVVPVKV